jgi:hypothetical protein
VAAADDPSNSAGNRPHEGGDAAPKPPEAPGGYWTVEPRKGQDGQPDIYFGVLKAGCPADQQRLKNEIERTLSALRVLYTGSVGGKFEEALTKLLSLAQVGLVGQSPSTSVAEAALESLQNEIVDREAGRVKNDYMIKLGKWALAFCVAGAVLYFLSGTEWSPSQPRDYRNFFLLWSGCMIGVWCSFAARKAVLTFFDLARIEEDRLDPPLRLIFSGMLTFILGLIFLTGFANVVVGAFEGAKFIHDGAVALLIGALSGIAEKALPVAILQRAQTIFQFEGAKKAS